MRCSKVFLAVCLLSAEIVSAQTVKPTRLEKETIVVGFVHANGIGAYSSPAPGDWVRIQNTLRPILGCATACFAGAGLTYHGQLGAVLMPATKSVAELFKAMELDKNKYYSCVVTRSTTFLPFGKYDSVFSAKCEVTPDPCPGLIGQPC